MIAPSFVKRSGLMSKGILRSTFGCLSHSMAAVFMSPPPSGGAVFCRFCSCARINMTKNQVRDTCELSETTTLWHTGLVRNVWESSLRSSLALREPMGADSTFPSETRRIRPIRRLSPMSSAVHGKPEPGVRFQFWWWCRHKCSNVPPFQCRQLSHRERESGAV